MKRALVLLAAPLLLLCSLAPTGRAAEPPAPAGMTVDDLEALAFRSDATGLTLPYRLFVPRGYDPARKYPLLLFLHGAGERGTDNRRQTGNQALAWVQPTIQAGQPAFVVYPQCPEGTRWVDTDPRLGSYALLDLPQSLPSRTALELLQALRQRWSIDPDRILVSGLSMGGYGGWDLALRFPDLLAGALLVCGAGDPSLAERLRDLPVWAFHGSADPVVPVSGSREMIEALRRVGGHPRYTEYPGVEHAAWELALTDPEALAWLLSRRRPGPC